MDIVKRKLLFCSNKKKNMRKLFTLVPAALLCMQSFALDYSNPSNNNYINEWGKLKLVGNQLSSEKGEPVQLRGWSTHGKNWQGACFDELSDFELMKSKGANLVRIAMYVAGDGGSEDGEWMKQCLDWTDKLGIYCLVDWHILTPGDPNAGVYSNAENFFKYISAYVKEKGYKHALYEICNEPNIDTEGDPYHPDIWVKVKSYAEKVLPGIAANDPNAVVIVGTPQWDKALSCPMENPLELKNCDDLNVMYTFHHYTCDQQFFRGILSGAAASIPVFATEWGVSTDDGGEDGQVCLDDADQFLEVCNGKNLGNQVISWANWSWSTDWRTSSAFKTYPNEMTQSGQYIEKKLKEGDNFLKSTSSPYEGGHSFDGKNDLIIQMEKYDKGGQNEAYYDFDREDWWNCKACNAGALGQEGFRPGEYVDVGYSDKNDKANCLKSLGYIVNGEWVKYTIDVAKAGDYDFEVYVSDHLDYNVVGISVDGKNALVGEDGNVKYKACRFPQGLDGTRLDDGNDGYDSFGWKSVVTAVSDDNPGYNNVRNIVYDDYKFKIRFEEAGQHVLGVAFLTGNSGLGGIKLIGKGNSSVDEAVADAPVIAPNPAEGGVFNVSVYENSTVKVVNSLGAVVYSANVEANSTASINLNAAPGVYFVSVVGETNATTEKLIVK